MARGKGCVGHGSGVKRTPRSVARHPGRGNIVRVKEPAVVPRHSESSAEFTRCDPRVLAATAARCLWGTQKMARFALNHDRKEAFCARLTLNDEFHQCLRQSFGRCFDGISVKISGFSGSDKSGRAESLWRQGQLPSSTVRRAEQ